MLSVEAVELAGVDTERSRLGTASRAREGDTLGDGEDGRSEGELRVLAGGLMTSSAISSELWLPQDCLKVKQLCGMASLRWLAGRLAGARSRAETLVSNTAAAVCSLCQHE